MSQRQIDIHRYSMLENDWTIKDGAFISPALAKKDEDEAELLIFDEQLRNGSIRADITILDSGKSEESGDLAKEASLVIRRQEDESCIYAGTGGFGAKFFIGKMSSAYGGWQPRAEIGRSSSIQMKRVFQLRVDFNGSRIALYENDVLQRMIIDQNYQIGQCGLRTWKTQARFSNLRILKAQPRAFLIMPFKSELAFVHEVIEETVSAYGIKCIRADQLSVSRPVMEDVSEQIAEADLVIVDFTDRNPNVYFEAGMAHAWKKDWIILAQTTDDLTFDVRHIRSVKYSNTMRADRKLKSDLQDAIEALQYQRTPESKKKVSATDGK